MKHFLQSLRMLLWMTLVTGVLYPVAVTLISQVLFSKQANGHKIERGQVLLGSELIGQSFESEKYFWSRPSSISYNPMPSGGSNLGPISADLKKAVDERRSKLVAAHLDAGEPPQDLLFASGSGVDPHISPEAARYQSVRIAKARQLDLQVVKNLIDGSTEARQLGIFGEPRVNVLALNLNLDRIQGIQEAPVFRPPPAPLTPAAPPGGSTQ